MLQVSSEKFSSSSSSSSSDSSSIEQSAGTGAVTNLDKGESSLSPPSLDFRKFFDGTDFINKSSTTTMMSQQQDFNNELHMTDEELLMNLDDLLNNDPLMSMNDFREDQLFSQISVESTLNRLESASSPQSPPLKPESSSNVLAVVQQQESQQPEFVQMGEPQDDECIEEIDSNSPTEKYAPAEHRYYQLQPIQHQQQPKRVPNVAFANHGLLPAAPSIDRSIQQKGGANFSRLVKVQPQKQQQPRETPSRYRASSSNFSANSYSPPPTPRGTNGGVEDLGSNSRGAIYARQYRQKNRERVEYLESVNGKLVQENDELREGFGEAKNKIEELSSEVAYLRHIIQNQSAIATVVNAVASNAPGMKLQFALGQQQQQSGNRTVETRSSSKRKVDEQPTTGNNKRTRTNDGQSTSTSNHNNAGICLHVNGDTVSVEMCEKCNQDSRYGLHHQQQ